MPRRLPSIRGCKKDQITTFNPSEAHSQKGFDFAFPSEPAVFHEGYSVDKKYASTPRFDYAKEDKREQDRQPTVTVLSQSRLIPNLDTGHSNSPAAQLGQSQHGLSSQSPQDVQQQVCKLLPLFKSTDQQPNHVRGSSKSAGLATKRRWRKISEVFRPGTDSDAVVSEHYLRPINVEEKKLGLPISRTPWRNPTSPPVLQDDFTTKTAAYQTIYSNVQDKPQNQRTEPDATDCLPPLEKDDLHPKLQVQIPRTPLERFSVMFLNIHGRRQSDLLIAAENMIIPNHSQADEKVRAMALAVPSSKRRATSPTVPRLEDSPTVTVSQGRRSSKYSLFPTTPLSLKPCSTTSSPARTRRRSVTAPAELRSSKIETSSISLGIIPPTQENIQYSSNVPEVNLPRSNQSVSQIEEKSLHVLSENEIFFDIKSFRDSNGVEGSHFEMTRPPSAAVQRARSRSNARKVLQENIPSYNTQGRYGIQEQLSRKLSVDTSAQIDETIAIVESLTSLSATKASTSKTAKHAGLNSQDEILPSAKPGPQRSSPLKVRRVEAATDGANQGSSNTNSEAAKVSSPVGAATDVEVFKLKMNDLASSNTVANVNVLTQVTSLNHSHHRISSTESLSHPPAQAETAGKPDIKVVLNANDSTMTPTLIPLSKYAPRQIAEDLVGGSAVRTIRLQQANTVNDIHCSSTKSEHQHPRNPKRASSSPDNLVHVPKMDPTLAAPPVADPLQLNDGTKAMPMLIAYVKPAAEVSVARKVSVTRKQSARLVEPRSNARTQVLFSREREEPIDSVQESREVEKKRRIQVDKKLPVVQEVHQKHKPGVSVSGILDSATICSSVPRSASFDLKLRSRLEKALPPIPVS